MQLAFDRLIEAMDRLAPGLSGPVIVQTGKGRYVPQNMEAREEIAPDEFGALVAQAEVLVSHAGIGSILTAARLGKPIVLLARRADLREHRNDHQIATAPKLAGRPGILIAAARGLGTWPAHGSPSAPGSIPRWLPSSRIARPDAVRARPVIVKKSPSLTRF
jgi:UDP-N-acetylglucosamine transferase subunit ALG13